MFWNRKKKKDESITMVWAKLILKRHNNDIEPFVSINLPNESESSSNAVMYTFTKGILHYVFETGLKFGNTTFSIAKDLHEIVDEVSNEDC